MESYSVLMSVYCKEQPEYLKQSIQSMLEQTIPTNDFVIVCDGPLTPGLEAVLAAFCEAYPSLFQIVRLEQNVGLGTALNKGMAYCVNELIARMDSDDISYQDRCERQLAVFQEQRVDIVSGTICEFENRPENVIARRQLPHDHQAIVAFAKKRSPFNHPAVMYRKAAVLDAGGYQHFYLLEDYHLWVRMLLSGAKAYNIEAPLLYMRSGEGLYTRRGGIGYLKSVFQFRVYMKRVGFIGLWDFFFCVLGQAAVCLLPNAARKQIYEKLLRN